MALTVPLLFDVEIFKFSQDLRTTILFCLRLMDYFRKISERTNALFLFAAFSTNMATNWRKYPRFVKINLFR